MYKMDKFILIIVAVFFILQGAAYCHDVVNVNEGVERLNDGKINLFYSKREGNYWVEATKKTGQELIILDKKINNDITGAAFQNAGFFLPYQAYQVGSWPEAVAIGDINSDGRNDVVMTTSFYFDPENDYHIFIFLQNISGGLEPPVKYLTSGTFGAPPETIDIGDVNNDGLSDVVIGAGGNIEVFLQNETGGLNSSLKYPAVNSHKIKIGDFNNDGLMDVAGIGWGTNTVSILLQNTSGILNPPIVYTVTHGGYDDLDVGDVNNDTLTDIVVMSGQSYAYPNIGVLLQKTDGTFGLPVYYDLEGNELTRGVEIGDINNDALQDVVVSYGGNSPYAFIGTFLQNDSGMLNLATSYSSYDCPEPVEIGDVNMDGRNDVLVAHGGWNAMGVYLQGADGMFLPYELYSLPYASHYNPHGFDVGDISGDGADDMVLADYNNGLVILYHSTVPLPDLTGQWKKFEVYRRRIILGAFTVGNIGIEGAGNFKIDYYLSNDDVFGAEDKLIRSSVISSLPAGDSRTLEFTYWSKVFLKGRFIIAIVDSENIVAESNEGNNMLISPLIQK